MSRFQLLEVTAVPPAEDLCVSLEEGGGGLLKSILLQSHGYKKAQDAV